eukprot:CAMPEP_0113856832 /NCGR_PEP_ID=MMETSP0372-20130328/9580_1 /TAXON_ID=340204 /ORGANISM="Lankesteria abbotti" /LENGTH=209 /DNA_ID=CAMNT_0000832127 /DNA_START=352 /DNA_END=978 /DNA_ORIENTATION=+ /assembly_acc=CAM_ASM_000359
MDPRAIQQHKQQQQQQLIKPILTTSSTDDTSQASWDFPTSRLPSSTTTSPPSLSVPSPLSLSVPVHTPGTNSPGNFPSVKFLAATSTPAMSTPSSPYSEFCDASRSCKSSLVSPVSIPPGNNSAPFAFSDSAGNEFLRPFYLNLSFLVITTKEKINKNVKNVTELCELVMNSARYSSRSSFAVEISRATVLDQSDMCLLAPYPMIWTRH